MLPLTPAVLAALAEGVSRLEDGDLAMCAQAREVRKTMARDHGLVLSNYEWWPAAEATAGYIRPDTFATEQSGRMWYVSGFDTPQELAPGQVLYLDAECTIPLRTF